LTSEGHRATTLKTVRLPVDLVDAIEREAKDEGITFNSVVNKIVAKFADFDRFAEKLEFVSLPRETLATIVQAMDEKTLETVARALGERVPRAMILFRHNKQGISAFLLYLSELSRYQHVGELEMSVRDGSIVVIFYHDMGRKWSIFLKGYVSQAAKSVAGISPTCEVAEDIVIMKLKPVSQVYEAEMLNVNLLHEV
jgi:hypothetical protein